MSGWQQIHSLFQLTISLPVAHFPTIGTVSEQVIVSRGLFYNRCDYLKENYATKNLKALKEAFHQTLAIYYSLGN